MTEKVQESLSFLTDYLAAVGGTPQGPTDAPLHWLVPRVCVDLPVLSGGEVHVEPFEAGGGGGGGVLFFHRLCEVRALGCITYPLIGPPPLDFHLWTPSDKMLATI